MEAATLCFSVILSASRQPLEGILRVLVHLTRRSRKTAFWSWRIMRECGSAISFYTEFTDEEPEAKKLEVLVLWFTQGGTG